MVSGKAVLIQGNDISTSGTDKHAMVAREGGNIYIGTNNTLSGPTTFASTNATLGIYRGSSVTMQGDGNLISNTDPGANRLALKLTQGAHFRQEGGHSVLNGGVRLLNMSSADFRDVEIDGDVFAKIFASLRFEDQDSDGLPTDTVSGDISIEHLANIDVKGSVSLDGNLSCSSAGTSSGATPTVTGSDDLLSVRASFQPVSHRLDTNSGWGIALPSLLPPG